jgi:hypothetical protein
MSIPKEMKHMKFNSLQIIKEDYRQYQERKYKLNFCINKLVNTKYNRRFNFNDSTAVAIKIQKCMATHEKAKIIQIILIDYRGFEEVYYPEEEYQD